MADLVSSGNNNYDVDTKGFLFTFQTSGSGVLSVYRKSRGRPVNLSRDPAPQGVFFLDQNDGSPALYRLRASVKNNYEILVSAIESYKERDLTPEDKSKLLKGLEGIVSLN